MERDTPKPLEYRRRFIIEELPKLDSPNDSHWQLFDRYVYSTALRIRSIRIPETGNWTRYLEKCLIENLNGYEKKSRYNIELSDSEYKFFESPEQPEIRKNRYFGKLNEAYVEFDIFLGKLKGLKTATVYFEKPDGEYSFGLDGVIGEITGNSLFLGRNLAELKFEDLPAGFEK